MYERKKEIHRGRPYKEQTIAYNRKKNSINELYAKFGTKKEDANSSIANLEAEQERRRRMKDLCRSYNRKPIYQMTDIEIPEFGLRQAYAAVNSHVCEENEAAMYAKAVIGAIRFFNARDKAHVDYMRYLEECKREAAAAKRSKEHTQPKP